MFQIDKKYTNLYKKDFFIGFEVECLIRRQYTYDSIKEKLLEIHRNLDIGDDGSVSSDQRDWRAMSYEIRTPPLIPLYSLNILNKVFEIVNKYGFTNKTCGLHFSVSPISDDLYYQINPFYISKQKIWQKMRKDFNRNRNTYCKGYNFKGLRKKISLIDIWKKNMIDKTPVNGSCHYNYINFDNVHIPRTKDSRIEIRSIGNEAYHQKFDLIVDYVNQSLDVIKRGCNGKEIILN